jgi:hypothetical protein
LRRGEERKGKERRGESCKICTSILIDCYGRSEC